MGIKLFEENEMESNEQPKLTEEQIKERKDKINKLLDIRGHDLSWKEKMIDIFGNVSISINIEQRLEDYSYLEKNIDSVGLEFKIEDFEEVDLEDEDAADMVREIFDDIVKEQLSGESKYT